MFSSVLNSVTAFLQSHITANWFLPFINILMAMTAVYIIIWMIYKSFGIMQGRDSAQDLMLGVSKFVVLFCILFMTSLIPTIGGYLTGFASSMQIAKPLDSAGNAIARAIREIEVTWDGADVDMEAIKALPTAEQEKAINDKIEKQYQAELENKKKAHENAQKVEQECKAKYGSEADGTMVDAGGGQYTYKAGKCDAQIKSANKAKADWEDFQGQGKQGYFEEKKKNLEKTGRFDNTDVNTPFDTVNNIVNGAGDFATTAQYMFKAFVAGVLLAVGIGLFFPLAMKIIQMAIQFIISLFALAAAVPLAAISLLYVKYFKNMSLEIYSYTYWCTYS